MEGSTESSIFPFVVNSTSSSTSTYDMGSGSGGGGDGGGGSNSNFSLNIYFRCFFLLLYTLLFVVGLVSNLLLVYFVLFFKRNKSITNKLIINLALADMLVVSICIPVTAMSEFVHEEWELGVFLCHVTAFIQGVSVSVSVLTLTTISLDRYLIICNPIKVRSVLTGRRIRAAVITVWLLSALIMSPLLFVFDYKEETHRLDKAAYSITIKTCYENWPNVRVKLYYEIFLVSSLFVMPAILMGLTFFKISKTLWFDLNIEKLGGSGCYSSATAAPAVSHAAHHHHLNHREESIVSMLNNKNEEHQNQEEENNDMDESTLNGGSPQPPSPKHQVVTVDSESHNNNNNNNININKNNTAMESLAYQLRLGATSHSQYSHEHHQSHPEQSIKNQMAIRKLIAGRKRVVKLIILLTVLFLVSWLPYHCFSLMIDVIVFKDTTARSNELINSKLARTSRTYLYPITVALALANSSVNPICYIAFSPSFVAMFRACFRSKKLLTCCNAD